MSLDIRDIRRRIRTISESYYRNRLPAILTISFLIFIGVYLQIFSKAASPYLSYEAEGGTISSPAVIVNDAQASGGKAVKFSSPANTGAINKASLLSQRVGFGSTANGGEAGNIVHVTNANDSGPGSLRAAVSGTAPKWVVFDGDYTIRLNTGILVGANTTIDGRGYKVTITGCKTAGSITCANSTHGLLIQNTSNVIVTNLTVSGFGNIALTSSDNPYDGVAIVASDRVWIDHLNLTHAGDKVLIVQSGSKNVTISWNHFYGQEQVFQIGSQSGASIDSTQTVTIHHNFFDSTGYRNPVISYGKAHVYNNYYYHWRNYAVRSERVAQMYLEKNIFEMGSSAKGSLVEPAGDGCSSNGLCDSRPGYLRAESNMLIGSVKLLTSQPQLVFNPSSFYPYTAQTADVNLKNVLRQSTGPQ